MIVIDIPYIKENRLYFPFREDEIEKQVWFEVEKEYEKYLVADRCDAILIAILNYAMKNNHDLILNSPVTQDLIYKINEFLIPSLTKHDKEMNKIKIKENVEALLPLNEGEAVGTGLSCGIDSFHSIMTNFKTQYKNCRLTHLCINNVGSFDIYQKFSNSNETKNKIYERAKNISLELNLPLVTTNSNLMDIVPQSHYRTHSYSSMFAVFCLQKLWKKYYYGSSGFDFSSFSLQDNSKHDSALYELLLFSVISNSNLEIISDGGAKNRFEKTVKISEYKIVQNNLHVCLKNYENCGVCQKCIRTLCCLDSIDKLDDFKTVFDIDYYKKNKWKYYYWLTISYLKKDKMNKITYSILKKKIPLYVKILAFIAVCGIFRFEYTKHAEFFIVKILGVKFKFKN